MKKFFLFLSILILAISLSTPTSAHTLYNGEHSVSGSAYIYWGTYRGSTKWTTARNNAISKWNGVGSIIITGDTASVTETLSFTDYRANDGIYGYWQQLSGADKLAFNDYYFEGFSSCQRNHTALHEVGHALNLEHNSTSGSVMRTGALCMDSLGSHDSSDLIDRWGYIN